MLSQRVRGVVYNGEQIVFGVFNGCFEPLDFVFDIFLIDGISPSLSTIYALPIHIPGDPPIPNSLNSSCEISFISKLFPETGLDALKNVKQYRVIFRIFGLKRDP